MVYKPKMAREYGVYRRTHKNRAENTFADNNSAVENTGEIDTDCFDDNEEAPEVYEPYGESNLHAYFDGDDLSVTDNGKLIGKYRGRSGYDDYQDIRFTKVQNRGPLPEGDYMLYYDQLQEHVSPEFCTPHSSNWNCNTDAWGFERIPVTPEEGTETYGRDNFYVHGGKELKSAGCIDLGLQMPQFGGILKKYRQNIPLTVRYKTKFGKNNKK